MTKEQSVAMKSAQVKLCLRRVSVWSDAVLQGQSETAVSSLREEIGAIRYALDELEKELAF
jgi:hypothetical protein